MTGTLKVKPAPGLQVRKEDGTPLPAEETTVPNTTYYRRRLRDGDLIDLTKPAAKAKANAGAEK